MTPQDSLIVAGVGFQAPQAPGAWRERDGAVLGLGPRPEAVGSTPTLIKKKSPTAYAAGLS